MKKRLVTTILMLAMALSLVACGGNGTDKDSQKPNTEDTQDDAQANKDTEDDKDEEPVDDGKVEFKITVVDANGAPVAGKQVQVCDAENCSIPAVTDANGVAIIRFAQSDECKAKIVVPYGQEDVYEYVYFEAGSTEITLTAAE